jgi:hypothetical protein
MEWLACRSSLDAGLVNAQKEIQQVLQSVKVIHEALHSMHRNLQSSVLELQQVLLLDVFFGIAADCS